MVHGMTSSVEEAFGSEFGCVAAIKMAGQYGQVLGFDYNWTQHLDSSGQQLGTFLDCLASKGFTNVDIEAHSEGVPVALAAAGHSTLSLNNMVLLGGPINGTPIANSQSFLNTAFANSLPRFGCVGGARLSDALGGDFVGEMKPDSPQLALIRSNFNIRAQHPNVFAVGGTQEPFSVTAPAFNLVAGRSFDITDGVIPISSALGEGSGLTRLTSLGGFPVSHIHLECDNNVIQAVGAHVGATPGPTATPVGCCLSCELANRCGDPCCQAGTCCN